MDIKKREHNKIFTVIYILVLIAYPWLRAGQGLSVGDTTYSPANFLFFQDMSGTWTIATYLANAVGYMLMKLPYGTTLFGLNIYTSLIVSATAVLTILILRRVINIHLLFMGEVIALGLCWCPTVILYNYLTYFLYTAGALSLFAAICDGDKKLSYLAGALLGMNVLTRLPNLAECALILAVWFAAAIDKKGIREAIAATLRCIAGYVAGFGIVFIIICLKYSPLAYIDMIRNMFAMTDKAVDYKPTAMITAMFDDYIYAGRWIALWIVGCLLVAAVYVTVEFLVRNEIVAGDSRMIRVVKAIISAGIIALVIRVLYGQGMFSFRYYEYGSVYFYVVLLLAYTSVVCVLFILRKRPSCISGDDETDTYKSEYRNKRILSAMVLIIIYTTCIGSNNGLYPIVNNMFIAAPYAVWVTYGMIRELCVSTKKSTREYITSEKREPIFMRAVMYSVSIGAGVLIICTLIQSVGFHMRFAFGDGIYGEPRDSVIEDYERCARIHTTEANAAELKGLMDYIYAHKTVDDTVLLYGEIPGLGYLLDMPSAISTFWADLDSYNYDEWRADIGAAFGTDGKRLPYIIVTLPIAAWESGDTDAISYFGVDTETFASDKKLADLVNIIHDYGYTQVYVNDRYAVYQTKAISP